VVPVLAGLSTDINHFYYQMTENPCSLIAIMLARLEMTVQECIDNYIEIMDGVFKKTSHRLGFDLQKFNLQIQGRFDSAELEAAIKRTVIVSNLPEDAKFRRANAGQCKL